MCRSARQTRGARRTADDIRDTACTVTARVPRRQPRPTPEPIDHASLACLARETEHALPASSRLHHGVLLLPPRTPASSPSSSSSTASPRLQAPRRDELAAAGVYTPEKRPFRPHVTVARLRPRTRPPRAADAHLEPLSFHGTAVTLYASQLHPSGARYEALATAPLAVP